MQDLMIEEMTIPKGYKNSALGVIPEDWEVKKLGSLSLLKGDYGINAGAVEYNKELPAYIRITDIDDEGCFSTAKKVSVNNINSVSFYLNKNDLVFVRTGATVGKSYLYNEKDGKLVFAGFLIRFRIDTKKANDYYLWTFTKSKPYWDWVKMVSMRSGQPGINSNEYALLQIPLPTIPEQKAIANCLSTWDKAIEKLNQLIAQKELRKKGLMQELLTGKKRLRGFDEEWKEVKLGELADKQKRWSFTGGPFGSNLKASDYKASGVRIIQLQNIGDGTFNNKYKIYTSVEKADELLSCNIYPGDIIISKMGDPVGRACLIPESTSRYLMASDGIRLAVNENKYNKKFILDYINFETFRNLIFESSSGSTRRRIGLSDLRNLILNVPEIQEQNSIAFILESADKEIQLLSNKLEQLKMQKKGLMQVLLTGKKRLKY